MIAAHGNAVHTYGVNSPKQRPPIDNSVLGNFGIISEYACHNIIIVFKSIHMHMWQSQVENEH